MTIGPAPMIRIEEMSVRFGIPFRYMCPPRVAQAGQCTAQKKRHQPLAVQDCRRATGDARATEPTRAFRDADLWCPWRRAASSPESRGREGVSPVQKGLMPR